MKFPKPTKNIFGGEHYKQQDIDTWLNNYKTQLNMELNILEQAKEWIEPDTQITKIRCMKIQRKFITRLLEQLEHEEEEVEV